MEGSQAIIKCLKENGINTIFGYPGGMILPLFDALSKTNDIDFILTTHEQSAAHAADGYARASGKAGVCIATSGPGATNLVTGIATAFMDSIPMVIITGQVDSSLLGKDSFQETDIFGITMPITKHNFKLQNANELIPLLRESFSLACSGRKGPVLIDIPKDFFYADVAYPAKEAEPPAAKPDADFLICAAEAINEILNSRRPVIIAGGGVIIGEAHKELLSFAEKYKIPVVSTLMGIGAFPSDHPLYMGFAGLHGRKSANYAVAEADLIIAVGSRFGDRQTGNITHYVYEKHFIHIDIDPAEIDKNVHSNIGLSGDMKTILNLLMQREPINNLNSWWQILQKHREKFAYEYTGKYDVPNIMHYISRSINKGDYVVATDVGQHQMWAAQHIRRYQPRTWFTSGGLGTMGFGLPAALGIQLYFGNEKRVIHIAGDGGIKMTGSEYYTIAALHLPIISIIINNESLGMIRQLQKVFYGARYFSCNFEYKMNYTKYIESFGIKAYTVHSMDEFVESFSDALKQKGPTALVVNIGKAFVDPMANTDARLNTFINF
ncbi:biosynthetic-type acetolactate synthase large subunit [Pectinatus cerevisiiphilus]|uniref:Acetolactate synthase n=1 Tax=Pectinatus cerevisiiphilus TaxID=86956 RepID=A0A4R3KEK0_9FIRM|nr:biosynthetic-type acetolactate synthase large subunit [Pectinatus cerevisiiphilus]TCS81389.1 acetolactate synthase large subunit [Pectinatus cerevisiiphilus]